MDKSVTKITLSEIEVDQAGRIIIKKPELASAIKKALIQKDPAIKDTDVVGEMAGFICSNTHCV